MEIMRATTPTQENVKRHTSYFLFHRFLLLLFLFDRSLYDISSERLRFLLQMVATKVIIQKFNFKLILGSPGRGENAEEQDEARVSLDAIERR